MRYLALSRVSGITLTQVLSPTVELHRSSSRPLLIIAAQKARFVEPASKRTTNPRSSESLAPGPSSTSATSKRWAICAVHEVGKRMINEATSRSRAPASDFLSWVRWRRGPRLVAVGNGSIPSSLRSGREAIRLVPRRARDLVFVEMAGSPRGSVRSSRGRLH